MILSISLLKRINRILLLTLPVAIVIPIGFQLGDIMLTWVEAILISLCIVVFLIYSVSKKEIELLFLNRIFIPIIIFLSILFLSLVLSENPSAGIMIFIRLIEAIIVMMVVLKSLKEQDLLIDNIFTALKFAGLVGSLYALSQFFFGIGLIGEYKDVTRVFGFLHGGVFGIFPASGFVLSTISIFTKKTWFHKTINLIISLICFLGLFLTLTRTWVLAAFIGVAVFHGSNSIKKLAISSLIILLIFLMSLKIFINSGIIYSLYGRSGELVFKRYNEILYGEVTSVNMRFEKWESAFAIALKHPMLGVGLENLDLNVKWATELGQKRSDNQWLDILATGGALSFLLFTYMMIWLLLKGFKLCKKPGSVGSNGRKFIALYCTWFTGSLFWAILYGFSGLMFAFLVTIGIYLNSYDKMRYQIISKN